MDLPAAQPLRDFFLGDLLGLPEVPGFQTSQQIATMRRKVGYVGSKSGSISMAELGGKHRSREVSSCFAIFCGSPL